MGFSDDSLLAKFEILKCKRKTTTKTLRAIKIIDRHEPVDDTPALRAIIWATHLKQMSSLVVLATKLKKLPRRLVIAKQGCRQLVHGDQ